MDRKWTVKHSFLWKTIKLLSKYCLISTQIYFTVTKMVNTRRKLIEVVFEKAKKEIRKESKSAIADYLSLHFEEQYSLSKDGRTFVRYYDKLVEKNGDYNIDDITLDYMSIYIGYKDFDDFCDNHKNEPFIKDFGTMKVAITETNLQTDDPLNDSSKISVHITNAPVFNIPEFLTKNKNSFGIVGLIMAGGFFITQKENENLSEESHHLVTQQPIENVSNLNQETASTSPSTVSVIERKVNYITPKKENAPAHEKECMYWKSDHYVSVYCDQDIIGSQVIALDEELLATFRKITNTDTLNVNNALGKVWYDKSNNELDFFTNYGIHPENGKTLRPVTKHIIEKYITNF